MEDTMKQEDLFRIAFHHPDIMREALLTLSYSSPVRKAVESELLKIMERTIKLRMSVFSIDHVLNYTLFTLETFHKIMMYMEKTMVEKYNCAYNNPDKLFEWWRKNFGVFKVSDAQLINDIVRMITQIADPYEYVIQLNRMMPEDPAFDEARSSLRNAALQRLDSLYRNGKGGAVEAINYTFGPSLSVAREWKTDSKKFEVVRVPDEIRNAVLEVIPNYSYGSYNRDRMERALIVSIRSEEEFIDVWKKSTDAWRVTLSKFYGKISKPLLDTLMRRYHRNEPIMEKLLKHPLVDIDTISWFALRGNKTAQQIINARKSELNGE
jgi:hypothetical protein